jgi:hypothetical protein
MPLVGKGPRLVGKKACNSLIHKNVGMNNLLAQVYGPSLVGFTTSQRATNRPRA